MQHNRFRICPMQRYLCFRIILLQVQIRQANNVRHLFSPLLQSRASRASCVRGSLFLYNSMIAFMADICFVNASRAAPGADTRAVFLRLPVISRPRRTPASFPGPVCRQCPEPIRDSGFFVCLSLAARAKPRRLFRSLFTHENNPDILLIGKMFGLFVLTVRIGFYDGK